GRGGGGRPCPPGNRSCGNRDERRRNHRRQACGRKNAQSQSRHIERQRSHNDEDAPPDVMPGNFPEKLKGCRPSISTFVVWLGLNREIRNKVKGYEIFVLKDYDPEKAYEAGL